MEQKESKHKRRQSHVISPLRCFAATAPEVSAFLKEWGFAWSNIALPIS